MNGAVAPSILLVEDSASDAEMTLRALARPRLASSVHWVKDGAEALDYMFREGPYAGRGAAAPNLVLLDIKMPKVDGIEVLRRLKDDDRTRATPVVMMTSSREPRDLVECYRHGANSYVVKPVAIDAYLRAVADVGLYWTAANHAPGPGGGAA